MLIQFIKDDCGGGAWFLVCPNETEDIKVPLGEKPKSTVKKRRETGCLDCFWERWERKRGSKLPSPSTDPMPHHAVVARISFNKTTAGNLSRWVRSGAAARFVEEHRGAWNDEDWKGLVGELTESSYWPMKPENVGRALERQRKQYLRWVSR
jgi:hypothetical protein